MVYGIEIVSQMISYHNFALIHFYLLEMNSLLFYMNHANKHVYKEGYSLFGQLHTPFQLWFTVLKANLSVM